MISQTEENYLKAIFKLSEKTDGSVSTNAISQEMQTAAASVTDMIKRLSKNGFVNYERYKGVTLTSEGDSVARKLIRKHRLWETFLFEKLNFKWDQVHDLAEQLEHIKSEELIDRIEQFLGYPQFDPHGDPIPNSEGKFAQREQYPLSEIDLDKEAVIVGVREHSTSFLHYLEKQGLTLGVELKVKKKVEYDGSLEIIFSDGKTVTITEKVGFNLFVKPTN